MLRNIQSIIFSHNKSIYSRKKYEIPQDIITKHIILPIKNK